MKVLNFILLICTLTSCQKCKDDDPDQLCSNKTPLSFGSLRTDGYYFRQIDEAPARREILFLYNDGVLLYGGMVYMEDLSQKEQEYSSGDYYNFAKTNQNVWGNFRIVDSEIEYERWYPSTNNQLAYVSNGFLLNDSSFTMVMASRCDGSEWNSFIDNFQFKRFASKPDSVNQFVQ
jgi:hypothetical protein